MKVRILAAPLGATLKTIMAIVGKIVRCGDYQTAQPVVTIVNGDQDDLVKLRELGFTVEIVSLVSDGFIFGFVTGLAVGSVVGWFTFLWVQSL